jgi:hypothetical protein
MRELYDALVGAAAFNGDRTAAGRSSQRLETQDPRFEAGRVSHFEFMTL